MPQSKKHSLKSIALAVKTQKQSTWQTVKKQWVEQMQSTIKTSEETKIWRNENKKKYKTVRVIRKTKQNKSFVSMM